MKILFVAQVLPYPLDAANRKHLYPWFKALARDHEVDLLLVEPSDARPKSIETLPNVRITCLGEPPRRALHQRLLRFARSLITATPATVLVAAPAAAKQWIEGARKKGEYGLAILFESGMGFYAELLRGYIPTIFIKPSVHAVDARQERERRGRYHPRWILEEWIIKRFEERTCRAATVLCPVNQEDASELVRRYRLTNRVEVVPIGVDFKDFPARISQPNTKVVAFFGNLEWGANVDAVNWLLHEIAPKVWSKHPDAMFRVIGTGGEALRKEYPGEGIEFTGHVPSIPDALADAAVGVVPVITGTGVRFKLLEFLSLGVPTVTTSLGKVGTECISGEQVLVADDATSFASAIVTLLSDSNLRETLGTAAAEIANRYRWEAIETQIRKLVAATMLVSNETIAETEMLPDKSSS
jgi:polysaccharide biosynthesis protein PslH